MNLTKKNLIIWNKLDLKHLDVGHLTFKQVKLQTMFNKAKEHPFKHNIKFQYVLEFVCSGAQFFANFYEPV